MKAEEFITRDMWGQLLPDEKRYLSFICGAGSGNMSYNRLIYRIRHGVYGRKYVSLILEEMQRSEQGG